MSYRVLPVLECFKNLPPRSTISSLRPHHLDPQYQTTGSQLSLIGTSGIQDRNMSGAERLFQPQTPATNYSASQGAYALSLSRCQLNSAHLVLASCFQCAGSTSSAYNSDAATSLHLECRDQSLSATTLYARLERVTMFRINVPTTVRPLVVSSVNPVTRRKSSMSTPGIVPRAGT